MSFKRHAAVFVLSREKEISDAYQVLIIFVADTLIQFVTSFLAY